MKVIKLPKQIKLMAAISTDGRGNQFKNLMVAALEQSGSYTETSATSGKIGFKRRK